MRYKITKHKLKYLSFTTIFTVLSALVLILSTNASIFASATTDCGDTNPPYVYVFGRRICNTYYNNAPLPDNTPNHRFAWVAGYTPTCNSGCPATGPGSYAQNFINFVANGVPGQQPGLRSCDNAGTGNFQSTADCVTFPNPPFNAAGVTYSTVVGDSVLVNALRGKNGPDFAGGAPAGNARVAYGIQQAEANWSTFVSIVNTYAAAGRINWNQMIAGPSPTNPGGPLANCDLNGSGQYTGRTDTVMARYPISAPTIWDVWNGCNFDGVTLPYMIFNNSDGTFFRINLTCGNLTGPEEAPPRLSGYTNIPAANTTTNDDEAPTSGTFTSTVTTNKTVNGISITHRFYWLEAIENDPTKRHILVTTPATDALNTVSVSPLSPPVAPSKVSYTFSRTIALNSTTLAGYTLQPGDQLCTDTIVAPARGDEDFSNNPILPPDLASDSSNDCQPVVAKPYVEVYGGDVFAGGGINNGTDACTPNNNAAIVALTDSGTANGTKGSGSQFASFATGRNWTNTTLPGTKGLSFASAKLDNNALASDPPKPSPPTDLVFSNTDTTKAGNFDGTGSSSCDSNYQFSKHPTDAAHLIPSPTNFDLAAFADPAGSHDDSWYGGDNVNVTVTTGAIASNASSAPRLVVYVDGNLTISSNITYSGSGGWQNPNAIPSITFIVKGNIYIGKTVSVLDGTYIAESDSTQAGPSGTIYTCTNATIDESDLYAQCNTQLSIHGTFMADHIKWQRAYGTLNKAVDPELPAYDGGSPKGSEVIIFGPESYITPSAANTVGPIQSITNLPPVL